MILSVSELEAGREPDIAIIGSGPAGMTLAAELHAAGKDVLVLEAGGNTFSERSQDIYRGAIPGDDYHLLDEVRLRYLGGSSNHWGGRCRPLDAIDFEARADIPGTGWPISRADLDPYAARAAQILEIAGGFEDETLDHGFERLEYQWSDPPVRFGLDYLPLFEAAQGPALCLEANVTGLETENGRVTAATVRDYDGNSARVRAGHFVLACGGIENSRLLLHFNAATEGRLVPQDAALGRYWMDHGNTELGHALLEEVPAEMIVLAMEPDRQRALRALNGILLVQPRGDDSRGWALDLAADLACHAPRLGDWAYNRLGRTLYCDARIAGVWEMAPHRDNRITLSATERDRFDIPKTVLHLAGTAQDRRTARQMALQYGEFLARSGGGRLLMRDWLRDEDAAPDFPEDWLMNQYHHLGGTRMSARAGEGVVDSDLRVWGQENLHVAGSSVFPTGGYANPTYTIVQLALRLADHLGARL